ncbi:MAG: tripartite tricarboxylate transporter substrate binding protein [Rhodocyclaceae bacterium]|nr:tripartite tricarboxylate transporter substrate binding protein [Rhodocyclaceae bacterium]
MRKQFRSIRAAVGVLAMVMTASFGLSAQAADSYPSKPIQVVVPVGAGGDTDTNARLFGKFLEKELGQAIVVTNVKGGGGTIGMRRVMDADPDGYTALFFHGEAMIPQLAGLVDFGIDAFQMVGIGVLDDTTVLATHKDAKYKTTQEFVDYAKAHPGEVEFGILTGGYPHLIGIVLQDVAGIKLNLVDVGGNAAKTVALKGHKIDVINTQYGLTKDYFTSGDFIALGLLSDKRNGTFNAIPTAKEQGYDLEFDKFFFFAMPKGTPQAIVDKFSAAMKKVVDNPEYKAEAAKFFVTPTYMAPAEATVYAQKQQQFFAKYQDLFRAASKQQ